MQFGFRKVCQEDIDGYSIVLVYEYWNLSFDCLSNYDDATQYVKSILKGERKMEKKNGFTILEMMIVMLIVALLLLITLPNIQQKEKIIRNKGCEALLEIVNSQIMLYEIDQLETPTSVQELIDFGYLKKGQDTCPDHSKVVIVDGQAVSQ